MKNEYIEVKLDGSEPILNKDIGGNKGCICCELRNKEGMCYSYYYDGVRCPIFLRGRTTTHTFKLKRSIKLKLKQL